MDSITIEQFGRTWQWPAADLDCRAVVFDTTADLEHAYRYCRAFNAAVQAGCNMGVWPWKMAQKFKRVFTFEPDANCWPHAVENLKGCANVTPFHAALGPAPGRCAVQTDHGRNMGAQYIVAGDDVNVVTIDSLSLEACDLIYLDIEGAELGALGGAIHTITEFRPVIAVEDKGLSKRFGTEKGVIEGWLAQAFGYAVVARPHRDVILACV